MQNRSPNMLVTHPNTGIARIQYYGFQGQEKDDEVKGRGNSVNYTFRMHDPRLGRFFAVDPLAGKYPWYSPYSFSGNKVINSVELEGLEEFVAFVRPTKTDPNLKVCTVYKTKQDGPLTVNYHHVNKDGIVLRSEDPVSQFKPNSAEAIGMSKKYNNTGMTYSEAMDVSIVEINKGGYYKLVERIVRNDSKDDDNHSLAGSTTFQYEMTLNFNTDKSSLDKIGVQNYFDAMKKIENLKNILSSNEISFADTKGATITIKGLQNHDMIVTGETDSRASNYMNSQGVNCGNPCLANDRANNVLEQLKPYHKDNNKIRAVTHQGTLNHSDRKSSVMFIPGSSSKSK